MDTKAKSTTAAFRLVAVVSPLALFSSEIAAMEKRFNARMSRMESALRQPLTQIGELMPLSRPDRGRDILMVKTPTSGPPKCRKTRRNGADKKRTGNQVLTSEL